mmetsp:Transcript_4331/g.12496  ORF Transcript_4331/g.12496 Transcript_4331/m.12496 type:complete len:232 (-) Transcript_4331:1297-1992(-)
MRVNCEKMTPMYRLRSANATMNTKPTYQKKAPGLSPNRGCSPFFDGADIVSYITCVYPLSVTTRKHTSSELPTLSKLGHALLHTRGVSRPSALRYSPTHSVWPATLVSLQLYNSPMKSCVPRMANSRKNMTSTTDTLPIAASDSTSDRNTMRMPLDRDSMRSGLIARSACSAWIAAALVSTFSSESTSTETTTMTKSSWLGICRMYSEKVKAYDLTRTSSPNTTVKPTSDQ